MRDQLAVSRQAVTDTDGQLEAAQSRVCELEGQLESGSRKREGLEEQLASLHARVETMREEERKLRETLSETQGKNPTASFHILYMSQWVHITGVSVRMQAGHQQTVTELQSQLSALRERVAELEREREASAIQHNSSLQQHTHSLSSVEKVSATLNRSSYVTSSFDRSCHSCARRGRSSEHSMPGRSRQHMHKLESGKWS